MENTSEIYLESTEKLNPKKDKISFINSFINLINTGLFFFAVLFFIVLVSNRSVIDCSTSFIYEDTSIIPINTVGLVLGTSKFAYNKGINPYFKFRMQAAVNLYKLGKIKHIIVSGDNHKDGYNEPQQMKDYLVNLGVKPAHITLDYAGFRTLDSVVRVKKIFGQEKITIISQKFHNQRAIYLAKQYNIDAIAFNAKMPWYSPRMKLRESLAKFKAVLDIHVLRTKPKFLGEKIEISLKKV